MMIMTKMAPIDYVTLMVVKNSVCGFNDFINILDVDKLFQNFKTVK